MVQTTLSTQTKVMLVTGAALATGLAAYALGYLDYDWRLWQTAPDQIVQQNVGQQGLGQQQQPENTGYQPPREVTTEDAVTQPALTIYTDSRLPDAIAGQAYETRLTSSGGTDVRWYLEQGALPAGLTLDEERGIIRGTAVQPGSSAFRLKVYFTSGLAMRQSQFTLNVVAARTVTDNEEQIVTPPGVNQGVNAAVTNPQGQAQITTTSLPAARVGQSYRVMLEATGDVPSARQWSVQGNLPTGIALSSAGELSGTPTQAGTSLVTIMLETRDASGAINMYRVARQYTVVVQEAVVNPPAQPAQPGITVSSNYLPDARVGDQYRHQLIATGGAANARYRWMLANGVNPPPGLTVSAEGLVSGTPTQSGDYRLYQTIVVVEGQPNISATVDLSLKVLPQQTTQPPVQPPANPGPTSLLISGGYPDGGIGGYYSSRPLEVSGGVAPYEWAIVNGNVPSGLYFSPNSQIAGYANQYGIFTFTVQVRDQSGRTTRTDRTIHIRPAQPVISANIDPDLANRLRRIDLIGVQVHDLIKLQDDGNPDTQHDTTVYYIGADGRRHSFPNPKVYFTWFPDFSRVRIVAPTELADLPLGANITYRPGSRLVKFMTDPRVYAVDSDRRLRWVKVESVAQALYGPFWARQVDDISDAFYLDYRFGQSVDTSGDYSVSGAAGTAAFPSDVLPR
ncbi:putative Ig domain-containing protein [Patescibacteria group bacterium]|nr:putative Ig domain-containing protein [Patescibacteria group bacterium]